MAGQDQKDGGGGNHLLKGWKQISGYLGKDERTAKRWAVSQNLPVHRVPGLKRAAVYAYSAELDLWLKGHRDLGSLPEPQAIENEADLVAELFEGHARAGALLLTYHADGLLELRQKQGRPPAARESFHGADR